MNEKKMNKNSKNSSLLKPSAYFEATLYLVDASSYMYRAYFAIRQNLATSKGFPTKAIFGITNMLLKLLREKNPTNIAVVWDAKGPTFRHELYDKYKANRPEMPDDLVVQIPWIRKIVDALGLCQLEKEGYEADDIIATIVKKLNLDTLIVSGDKDLIQLISDKVTIWDPMKDEIIDLNEVKKRFGIEPYQYLDVLALCGDSSDNIPGVPGIGIKTALKLIQEFGSIENLLANLDKVKQKRLREKLKEAQKDIPLWRKLVSLEENVPIEVDLKQFKRKEFDLETLKEIFTELEFNRLLKELVGDSSEELSKDAYKLVIKEQELVEVIKLIKKEKRLIIDTETTSEFPMRAKLVGISICVKPPQAFYIPIAHKHVKEQLDKELVISKLKPVLESLDINKIGQNIKYDKIVLKRNGAELNKIEGDTMIASYLLNPSRHHHNLDEISQEILGHTMLSYKEVIKNYAGRGKDFSYVPIEIAKDYSCKDVHVTALVKDILWQRLKKADLWRLFQEVEVPLIDLLARMEMAGIMIDQQGLDDLHKEFSKRLLELEKRIKELAGVDFNINSTRQLAEVLFEHLKLPQIKKTKKKTGYSTDVEVLKALSNYHELPRLVLEYRNLLKLNSTYVDGLKRMIHPETGRIHTSFNQTVTATGRLSSSDPNLQNIPVRTEEGRRIRALFIAAPGNVLISADYSQIDLRVLAHYSQDPALLKAFRNDEDIHRKTASEVFGVSPEFVTPEMRRIAKTVNFGIIYGMSAYGLAKELGIERHKAKEFIDKYFEKYPKVKEYMNWAINHAREKGYVTTILGRRRYIPDINSKSRPVREFAERTAINTPIQGSAADIIKLAMLRVDEALKKESIKAEILLQVHDELVLECDESLCEKVAKIVKFNMENVIQLDVPLTVSVGWGKNWAEV